MIIPQMKFGLQDQKLEDGDIVCPNCEGLGTEFSGPLGSLKIATICHTCRGAGKLDWLERLFGKIGQETTAYICNDKRGNK
jgi:DnaJ-class molecular chaperone